MRYLSILTFASLAVWLNVPAGLALIYFGASVFTFGLYAIDKRAAMLRTRRTPERTLLVAGFACGWPGAALAQQWLRHKTAKPRFLTWYWMSVALNASLLVVVARRTDWLLS